jgi:superkiller protein 3
MRAAALALLLALAPTAAYADKDADSYYKQGLAYKSEGKIDEAIAAMDQAVQGNPKHAQAWAALGNLYKQKKDLAKSIDAYEHAVAVWTGDKKSLAVILTNLGTAYANSNQVDKAIDALTKAYGLDGKDPEIQAKLGVVKRKKGDYPGAIQMLEASVKTRPDDAETQHNLGVAYRYAKRLDDAIAALQRAITLSPNEATYHVDLAIVYRHKQDPDHAIPEYEKAVALDPSLADAWFDLGYMYKENHDNDKAIDAFNHYLEANKGKDKDGAKRVGDEVNALKATGGTKKAPPKK